MYAPVGNAGAGEAQASNVAPIQPEPACPPIRARDAVPLAYWRSTSNFEVDFVLGDRTAIEVKAKNPVAERDLRGLRALREERLLEHDVMVCLETRPRRVDGIEIVPWKDFLDRLWEGAFTS